MTDNRKKGLYVNKETRDEAILAVKQLEETSTDKVITLVRRHGQFCAYSLREWLFQCEDWKKLKAVIYKCNILPIKCGYAGDAWLMTITPKEEDLSFCPLAMSFGIMVDGFSYISKDRDLFDLAWAHLGRHIDEGRMEMPPAPAPRCVADSCKNTVVHPVGSWCETCINQPDPKGVRVQHGSYFWQK
jgi:hypothetical protein